jgi:hypothetical protein
MILSERIHLETIDGLTIERQKNGVDEPWYGLCIVMLNDNSYPDTLADNEEWIINTLVEGLKSFPKEMFKEMGILRHYNKERRQELKKALKLAKKLGWFGKTK